MRNANSTKSPKVLLCWAGRPGYVPPPTLSENQVTIYSHHDKRSPGTISPQTRVSESQEYDLEAAVKTLGYSTDFDLICVSTGGVENNHPRNLASFNCPKVLLSGDTHHASAAPIHDLFDHYLDKESYDLGLSLHNRDHTKWFGHGRKMRLGWAPGLTAQNVPVAAPQERKKTIAFVGSWQRNHLRRKNFIGKFQRDGLPFDHQKLSRQQSAQHYANSLISFNCSLNGDLNLRVFEILSSGGLLLTDRLAKESGMEELFKEGHDYIGYTDYRECREKVQYYLAHPEQALKISQQGLSTYRENYLPEKNARKFLDWALLDNQPQLNYSESLRPVEGIAFKTRLEIYEFLLISQLWNETTNVLYIGERPQSLVGDVAGLVRVKSYIDTSANLGISTTKHPQISMAEAGSRHWKAVIVDSVDGEVIEQSGVTADKIYFI